jgi:glycosyltransferase involved in cell wall biosynthesis
MTKCWKIAVFTPYLPYPPNTGGKTRSYYLIKLFSSFFEIDLYTTSHGLSKGSQKILLDHFNNIARMITVFQIQKSPRWWDRLGRILGPLPRSVDYFQDPQALLRAWMLLNQQSYEGLVADELCMTPYIELRLDLPRVIWRQKIDSVHYAEVSAARPWSIDKILDWIEARKLRRYERRKIPIYQGCVTCSEADAEWVRRDAPYLPVQVVPNGVDLDFFQPSGLSRAIPPILLFVGTLYYYPNIDAINYFFSEIYPRIRLTRSDVRVQIVGLNPPVSIQRLGDLPGVEVIGGVPDVRPYYKQASVFIVPLRLGGGTRLKIVEAMAMGLPVVSTSTGAEGLSVHPGEDILIADDPQAFAEEVLRLLSDPALWHRIAAGGQRLAQAYDWRTLARPVIDLMEQVIREWKR